MTNLEPPEPGMRRVGNKLPELLLTQEHHMCPGCGEPLALLLSRRGVEMPLARFDVAVTKDDARVGIPIGLVFVLEVKTTTKFRSDNVRA